MTNEKWKFSRSHVACRRECPRLQYLTYYADGTGYESSSVNVEQSTGTLLHAAVASIMDHLRTTDTLPSEAVVAASLTKAVAEYRAEVGERGFDLDTVGDMKIELLRQSALVEGLVRAWVAVRLPELHTHYRVLAVEEEWEPDLGDDIVCMMRIDAVLEDRSTHETWPIELKTTGYTDDRWLEKWRYDTQTLMHAWAAEEHYGRPCGGVKIEAFYKGYKGKDSEGSVIYHSPLVRGYLKRGNPPFDEDEFSWDKANARRKGWEGINVWEHMSMRDWVQLLPADTLRGQLFAVDVYRNEGEVEDWIARTVVEQREIREAVSNPDVDWLPRVFPARMDSWCFQNMYRRKCRFLPVCWEGIEPGESDLYRVRMPHHSTEGSDD